MDEKKIERAAELILKHLDEYLVIDDQLDMSADDGTNDLTFPRVKQGALMKMSHLSGYDDTSSPTRVRVGYYNGHRNVWLKTQSAPLISETIEHNGEVQLREGMYPIVRFEGATSGDDIYASLNAVTIKI